LLGTLLALSTCFFTSAGEYCSTGQCAMNVKDRTNCGYSGISVKECQTRGCCFDAKYPGVPWCFYPHLKTGNIPL
uniref:P-type domain-containing protein n=1 Tax=Chrysemys picta bellii TaxID=8478 RepID=A0A8C3FQZ4_CHRPI